MTHTPDGQDSGQHLLGSPGLPQRSQRFGVEPLFEREKEVLGFLDYAALVWKFKKAFVLFSLLGLVGAVGLSLKQMPRYRAVLQLEVQQLNTNFLDVQNLDPSATNNFAPDGFVQVQVKVLQSEALLDRVIRRLQLDARPDYIAQSETPMQRALAKLGLEEALARLPQRYVPVLRQALGVPPPEMDSANARALRVASSNLKVKAAAQSNLVELTYSAPDRETPTEFLNALATEFVAQTMEMRWAGTQRTADWLKTQLTDMRESLEVSERKLQEYARDSGMLDTSDRESVGEEKLRQLQAELSKAQAERAALQAQYERIVSSPPEQLPQVLDHPLLRDYFTRLADLQRERSQLIVTMKPEHQKVREVESQLAGLNKLIGSEVDKVLGRLRNEFEAASRRESLLDASFQQQSQAVSEQAASSVPYIILRREVESKRQFYQDMIQKVDSAGVATAIRANNIQVINPAQTPMLPYSPNLPMNAGIGLAGGLLLATVWCFVREGLERRDRKQWRVGETTQYLRMPELGAIPKVSVEGRRWLQRKQHDLSLKAHTEPAEDSHLAIWRKRPPNLVASFHAVLDSLIFAKDDKVAPRVVAITSPLPGDGKTTIASFLALAAADLGKRVLLIDADLRRPQVHKYFGIVPVTGLGPLLESESAELGDLAKYIVRMEREGIDVMPAGSMTKSVARLLASPRLDEVLQELRGKYDTIIIDTPPVLPFPDSRQLGRHSDGVVLVVRSNQTPVALSQQATEWLESSGNTILGAVLNDWEPAVERYSSYYGRYAGA